MDYHELAKTILAMDNLPVIAIAGLSLLLSVIAVYAWSLAAEARLTREHYRETIENLAEGLYRRCCVSGKMLKANRSLVELNGYHSCEEMIDAVNGTSLAWYVDPKNRKEFKRILMRDGVVKDFVSEVYRHKTRERIWVTENARIVREHRTGRPLVYEGSVREITQLVQHRQLEERLEKLANNLPGGLFQLLRRPDGSFSCPYVSTGFFAMFGLSRPIEEIDPNEYLSRIHPQDLPGYVRGLQKSAEVLELWTYEFRYRRDNGESVWLFVTATPEKLADGSVIWHGHVSDVSARKHAEERVHQLAYYDPLTELPNRRLFTRRLEVAIAANHRRREHGAVLFLDLDNFKTLNDTHGHEVGDLLLKRVAGRLQDCVRECDTVGRFGGDEFVILLDGLGPDREAALANARGATNKILREFGRGFDLGAIQHAATPSIGVVVFDANDESAAEIIKSADVAMYEAKKNGRNSYALFDPASLKNISEHYALHRELAQAIARNQLFFEYQPQVDLEGRIVGAEALIRWRHPERGILAPAEFMSVAEMSGLIMDINNWVMDEAVSCMGDWRQRPHMRDMALSVNVPVQQFRAPGFVARLCNRIDAAGIDPRRLTLELTEHVMARDPEHIARRMEELRRLGLRFSLDDFGTGYSSLSQLNRFPFDEVKIDGVFVSDIEQRHSNRTLIEAILAMAGALGLETVAEHVGSAQQVEFLKARGCRRYQGFYYHPPISGDALLDLVAEQSGHRNFRVISA